MSSPSRPWTCSRPHAHVTTGSSEDVRRKVTVEPVIGQVKNTVLPRFSLRSLTKVQGEFSLACAVHNLKKLWKLGWELPSLAAQAA
ncbi:transposase [Archangium violaceum]|uniref:transposase n=1 Tax=Archangium violaceum TaxID=83451 RepID=UPI002B2F025B|nr:transposase [Archangium gephyra]